MLYFYILIFLASCLGLFWAGKQLVGALMRMAKFLQWREFVLSFVAMALAASLPNLFVGISSALHGIPELSFGDVVGGGVIDLTIAMALAVLIAKGIQVKSRIAQKTCLFTMLAAALPIILILDGQLGRGDAIILLCCFFLYLFWLFSKEEHFKLVYNQNQIPAVKGFKIFLADIGRLILGIVLLLLAAEGVIKSATFFAETLNLGLPLIGILIVGLGNALPETYFAIASAKKGQAWMVLGNLMGSVIVPATLVLGIVALIDPIEIQDFSPFALGRAFLLISAIFFFIFVRTGRKISQKEALFLLSIYILFLISEIFLR